MGTRTDNFARRRGVLRFPARGARFGAGDDGGLHSRRRIASGRERLSAGVFPVPGALRTVCPKKAEGSFAFRGVLRARIRLLPFYAQPDHEPDADSVGRGSGGGARYGRSNCTAGIRIRYLPLSWSPKNALSRGRKATFRILEPSHRLKRQHTFRFLCRGTAPRGVLHAPVCPSGWASAHSARWLRTRGLPW